MSFSEDLSVFFDDFATTCKGVPVIFEEAEEALQIGFDGVQDGGCRIFFAAGSLTLAANEVVLIDGKNYRVRHAPRTVDDGKFEEVGLVKL